MLLVVAATAVCLAGWGAMAAWLSSDPTTATVERGALVLGADITGSLRAIDSSTLGPPRIRDFWQFKIAMMAPEGKTVSKGQPVLAFDTSELEQRLRERNAALDAARAEVEKQRVNMAVGAADDDLALAQAEARLRKATLAAARPSQLFSSLTIEKAKLDLASAELEVDAIRRRIEASRQAGEELLAMFQADATRAEADVTELQGSIARMQRTAPRDGMVIYVTDEWSGEKKKVGDSCSMWDTAIEIPDLSRMEGDAQIAEALAGQVREGQPVTLHLDAHPDVEYRGHVQLISRSVQVTSWRNPLKVVRLVVALDATDPETMRPGMRFRGTVETERLENVVTVPLGAVFPSPDGPVVVRRELTGWHEVAVRLGRRNKERVEVLDGIDAGDRLALEREAS